MGVASCLNGSGVASACRRKPAGWHQANGVTDRSTTAPTKQEQTPQNGPLIELPSSFFDNNACPMNKEIVSQREAAVREDRLIPADGPLF
jgi:hypothetical protein